ncbi:MAG: CHAT domain-containing protein [Aureispira sp.]|nr:CHAT domain-containing protein [Aureispira sp.]
MANKDLYISQTEPFTLALRSTDEYSIQFFYSNKNNKKEFTAKFIGSGITHDDILYHTLNNGDFLKFISINTDSRFYTYTDAIQKTTFKGRKAYINTIKLDQEAIQWLANNSLSEIRLYDTKGSNIYPFRIHPEKDAKFGTYIRCFYHDLIINKQIDTTQHILTTQKQGNALKNIESNSCQHLFDPNVRPSDDNSFKTLQFNLIQKISIEKDKEYHYDIALESSSKKTLMSWTHYSDEAENLRHLKKGLNVTFTNYLDQRKTFVFGDNEKTKGKINTNSFELSQKDLAWLSSTAIYKIEFSSNNQSSLKIHSYDIGNEEQDQFQELTSCCYKKQTGQIIPISPYKNQKKGSSSISETQLDTNKPPQITPTCTGILDSNHIINKIHRLSTLSTMGELEGVDDISRAYILKFVNNETGLFLKVKRQGGNEGDVKQPLTTGFDIVFIAKNQEKRKVRLIGQNRFSKSNNFYSNQARLTLKDLEWLNSHQIMELRLGNPKKEEEYPTTLNNKSRIRIRTIVHCFYHEYMASPILNPIEQTFNKATNCHGSIKYSTKNASNASTRSLVLTGKAANSYQYTISLGNKSDMIFFIIDQKKGKNRPSTAPRANDKLMLVNTLGERRVFTFIDQGKPMIQTPQGPVPNYSNEIHLGLQDIEWMSTDGIQQIRLITKKYPKNEPIQLSFTLTKTDKTKLYQNINCFNSHLHRGDETNYVQATAQEDWEFSLEAAKTAKDQVNYQQALEQSIQSVQQAKAQYGKESKEYAQTLFETAKLQEELFHEIEAEGYFSKSLKTAQKAYGEGHPFVADIHKKFADFYEQQEELEDAEEHYLNYLAIVEKNFGFDSEEYTQALAAISSYYTRQEEFDKAQKLAQQAKKRYKKGAKTKKKKGYLDVVVNAARVSAVTDSLSSAQEFYEEAEQLAQKQLNKKESKRSQITMELVDVYIADKKYDKAQKRLEKLDSSKSLNALQKTIAKDQMASIQMQQGQYQAATNIFVDLTHDLIQQLYEFYPVLDDHERGILLDRTHNHLSKVYSALDRSPDQFSAVTDKIEGLNLAVKNLVLENHIDFRQKILASNDPEISSLYKNWSNTKEEIGKAYMLSQVELTRENISLDSLREVAIKYEKQLHRLLQQQEKIYFPPVLDTIKNVLESHEAIVDFIHFTYHNGEEWTDSTRYAALVINPNLEKTEYVPLAGGKDIQNILDFEIDPTSLNYITDITENESLYQLIWRPINTYLQKSTTIHVATSGLLNKIALGALIVDSLENGFLLQQYNIHYYSSFRDWNTTKDSVYNDSLNQQKALLIGGVEFDMDSIELVKQANLFRKENDQNMGSIPQDIPVDNHSSQNGFSPLPGTQQEVEQISSLLREHKWNTQVLIGDKALEEKLKFSTGINAPKILHLATHGYFYPEPNEHRKHRYFNDSYYSHRIIYAQNPLLRSGLMLAGVNCYWDKPGALPKGVDDGILTAYEVAGLDLYNTDLVILSACESGKGTINDMEGVLGLQRAFRLAGSQHVIVSLWKVPDEATAELMELFYKYHLKGYSIYTAFRKAQKEMSTFYENPYYWASFMLIEGKKSEVSELEEFYMQQRDIENALAKVKQLERQRKYTEILTILEETAKLYDRSALLHSKMEKPAQLNTISYLLKKVNNLSYLKKAIIYYKNKNDLSSSFALLKKAIERRLKNSCDIQNDLANLIAKQLYATELNWKKTYKFFAEEQGIYKNKEFTCFEKQFKIAWKALKVNSK